MANFGVLLRNHRAGSSGHSVLVRLRLSHAVYCNDPSKSLAVEGKHNIIPGLAHEYIASLMSYFSMHCILLD